VTETPPLVLASASPRRTGILTRLGLEHEVRPAEVDEAFRRGEEPRAHVERLAREKAEAVAGLRPEALVLAGDTVVVLDGRVLGKPVDADEAARTLGALSGRAHTVFSALALAVPGGGVRSRVDLARVTFRDLTPDMIRSYVETGEPLDKAGAYGIQGLGAALVQGVEGDYYAVVGLPVSGLISLLADAGWRYTFQGLRPG
jgi:septum formation protein